MERTYYTLDDIRKALGYLNAIGPFAMYSRTFSIFLNGCLTKESFMTFDSFTETNESQTCFRQYIWPRFYKETIIYVDSDESEDFVKKFAETKVGQIFA